MDDDIQLDYNTELDRDIDCIIEDDKPPLIKPGEYWLGYEFHQTCILWGAPKVALWFTVLDDGEFHGTRLARYYNVKALRGTPRKYGQFKVKGYQCDFVTEHVRLFGEPVQLKRLSLTPFKNVLVKGEVRTVTRNSRKHPIPDSLHRSVIDHLITAKPA